MITEVVQNCTVTGFDFPWWGWLLAAVWFMILR
jgi:hypothetical protein